MGQLFLDRDGDTWERTDDNFVRRLRDGNVGGWYGGKGLKEIIMAPTPSQTDTV